MGLLQWFVAALLGLVGLIACAVVICRLFGLKYQKNDVDMEQFCVDPEEGELYQRIFLGQFINRSPEEIAIICRHDERCESCRRTILDKFIIK
jgi:hypothetical protein